METVYVDKIGTAPNAWTVWGMDYNGNCNIIFQGSKKAVIDMAEKNNFRIDWV